MDERRKTKEKLKNGSDNNAETVNNNLLLENNASKCCVKESSPPNEENNSTLLQKKLEKKIEQARRSNTTNVKQGSALLPLKRVPIPIKKSKNNEVILVWDSDSENDMVVEDNEVNQHLLPDQYEMVTEDEDLDLIFPESFSRRCICCKRMGTSCSIQ